MTGNADFTENGKPVTRRPPKRFYESHKYQQATRLREGAAAFNMVAAERLP